MTKYDKLLEDPRGWLLTEIKAGHTDSKLVQRFVIWLGKQPGNTKTPMEAIQKFLEYCKDEHIYAAIVDDELVFGFYRDGIRPQPYCVDYEGMKT